MEIRFALSRDAAFKLTSQRDLTIAATAGGARFVVEQVGLTVACP